ncbi:MAG: class I SAM-dependent methyltransferase [Flammeovirgaceae bacterium]
MSAIFDHIAANYDDSFTYTHTGKLQRQLVWNHLNQSLPSSPLNVLETNCGTGEDALYLAAKGHQVIATDISEEMVIQTRLKVQKAARSIRVEICSIQKSLQQFGTHQFDLIFSNFGGFNCVSPRDLSAWAQHVPQLLTANGRIILVIMPTYCIWESIAFLKKFNFKAAFRRSTRKAVRAIVGQEKMPIWYYSPRQIKALFSTHFQVRAIKPIGFFLPPSYLDTYFHNKNNLLRRFYKLDQFIEHARVSASLSDHFLIDLQLRSRSY